jgi:hypothetical protein
MSELEECERKWPWPNLRQYPSISLEAVRRTAKILRIRGVSAEIQT